MIVVAKFSYITQQYKYNGLAIPYAATQIRDSIIYLQWQLSLIQLILK